MTSCSCSTAISAPWARRSKAAGGRVDKFIGDGVMAIFGLDRERRGRPAARRSTRRAAWRWRLDDLNEALSGDLDQPLRIGIGLHAGPAIVGEMGYGGAPVTAIGDTVNTASRLESLTKEFGFSSSSPRN